MSDDSMCRFVCRFRLLEWFVCAFFSFSRLDFRHIFLLIKWPFGVGDCKEWTFTLRNHLIFVWLAHESHNSFKRNSIAEYNIISCCITIQRLAAPLSQESSDMKVENLLGLMNMNTFVSISQLSQNFVCSQFY